MTDSLIPDQADQVPAHLETVPETVPAIDGTPDAIRGALVLNMLANGADWRNVPPFTIADLLAAIRDRVSADEAAIRRIARTMRAYGSHQYGETRQFLPTYVNMIARGGLRHHAWHEHTETAMDWPMNPLDGVRDPDASRVLVVRTAPERAHLLAYGASVADVVAAWSEVHNIGTLDVGRLAEALAEAAADNGWCPVYDRLVSDLNGHCADVAPYMGEPFYRADPARTLWNVDGSITVTFYLSTSVAASDESEATDNADFSDAIYELHRELQNVGASHSLSRYDSIEDIDSATDTGEVWD